MNCQTQEIRLISWLPSDMNIGKLPAITFEIVKKALGDNLTKIPLVWELYTDNMLIGRIQHFLGTVNSTPQKKLSEIFMSLDLKVLMNRRNELDKKVIFKSWMPKINIEFETLIAANKKKNS